MLSEQPEKPWLEENLTQYRSLKSRVRIQEASTSRKLNVIPASEYPNEYMKPLIASVSHLLPIIGFSQLPATFKTNKSSNFLPTICNLVGNHTILPSFTGTNPTGRLSTGLPDELNTAVLYGIPIVLLSIFSGTYTALSGASESRKMLVWKRLVV